MTSWLQRLRTEIHPHQHQQQQQSPTQNPTTTTATAKSPQTPLAPNHNPNSPLHRFNINQKCIYERRLPGGSYITAHIQRLQSGYYDSPMVHEDLIPNVRFVAVNFVFHPSRSGCRFLSAEIRVALRRDGDGDGNGDSQKDAGSKVENGSRRRRGGAGLRSASKSSDVRNSSNSRRWRRQHDGIGSNIADSQALVHTQTSRRQQQQQQQQSTPPRFLRHAPHLLFGAISPETLNWNFNLAGSLGVSQAGANASLSPSGGMTGSYKLYEMMRIQGSVRGLHRWFDQTYDIEDGEIVWTLEENRLQKSGLPREFTFVMLLTKGTGGGGGNEGDGLGEVKLDIDIKPVVAGFLGMSSASYPGVLTNMLQYQPMHKDLVDLDREVGQRFQPEVPGKGFNFAALEKNFDEFVWLPGTTWSTKEATGTMEEPGQQPVGGTSDVKDGSGKGDAGGQAKSSEKPPQLSLLGTGDNTLKLRVILDSSRGSPIPALPYPSFNLKPQPPYPSSRGPSPAIRAPTSATSSIPSKADSKRRSITIVSSTRPSGSPSSQRHTSQPPLHKNDMTTPHRRVSRSPTLRRRTSRSSLDKEFRSPPSAPRQSTDSGYGRPHTMHEPLLSTHDHHSHTEIAQRPLSWYTHTSTPPPKTADSEATDTGTVVHHPIVSERRPSHQSERRVKTRQAKVTQTPYPTEPDTPQTAAADSANTAAEERRPSHQSEYRIKTKQAEVTPTPYPVDTPASSGSTSGINTASTLRYGDETSDEEDDSDSHHKIDAMSRRTDHPHQQVPIIAVPRKSSKRASHAYLTALSTGANSSPESTESSARSSRVESDVHTHVHPIVSTDHHEDPIIGEKTPTQKTVYSTPGFMRSASGVFHDASEQLPPEQQQQHDTAAQKGAGECLANGEYDAKNVF